MISIGIACKKAINDFLNGDDNEKNGNELFFVKSIQHLSGSVRCQLGEPEASGNVVKICAFGLKQSWA